MDSILSTHHRRLRDIAEEITRDAIAPGATQVDADAAWPAHSMKAIAEAGLLGLHVPKQLGGHEQGLLALAVLSETIARGCSSSALCFGMHCVGAAVITAKATPLHEERYLGPIAAGRHITTLALSESGTGAHFYFPQTKLTRNGDGYIVEGTKQFITNGGHADSYVISTQASEPRAAGDFTCLVLDHDTEGLEWLEPWKGLGLRFVACANGRRPARHSGA